MNRGKRTKCPRGAKEPPWRAALPAAATGFSTVALPRPTHTRSGGETKSSSRAVLPVGEIEGRPFHTGAMIIDRIGKDQEGKAIEVLFGAPGVCPAYGDRSEEVRNCDHFFAKFEDNSYSTRICGKQGLIYRFRSRFILSRTDS